jgi:uncharacterized protein (TIGR01777 family)
MKILISGSSGLVGSALVSFLQAQGHQIFKLVRTRANLKVDEIGWDLERGVINADLLEELDAVVHLAGENIAEGRWTEEKKKRIRDSRVKGTSLLSHALAQLRHPPQTFICASAIGYYGNRGAEILTEKSVKGIGFLADVCQEWEAATVSAANKGIRVANLRFGVVLSDKGGVLVKMRTPFEWGLGGKIGTGEQYMSWIVLEDLINVIQLVLQKSDLKGPINVVSPHPVTNAEFTKELGQVLHRPTFMQMPAFMARLAFGEMADELLLASERVAPEVLMQAGFKFNYPQLKDGLEALLS